MRVDYLAIVTIYIDSRFKKKREGATFSRTNHMGTAYLLINRSLGYSRIDAVGQAPPTNICGCQWQKLL